MFKEARELLDAGIPGPDQALHCWLTGRWDLMVGLVAIIEQHPAKCKRLRIATLTYNRRNTLEMLQLLENKKIDGLTLLASKFFLNHYADLAEEFEQSLSAFSGSVVGYARCHAKLFLFDWDDGSNLVIESSANARSSSNLETATLVNSRELHDFHAAQIDRLVKA
jgi:hypothetical protein